MTKLLEWLLGIFLFLSLWSALLLNKQQLTETQTIFVVFLPVITLGIFGMYAVSVVLWRVFTFNNCEEAAAELQKQILQAKEDLRSKGYSKFEDS